MHESLRVGDRGAKLNELTCLFLVCELSSFVWSLSLKLINGGLHENRRIV